MTIKEEYQKYFNSLMTPNNTVKHDGITFYKIKDNELPYKIEGLFVGELEFYFIEIENKRIHVFRQLTKEVK